MVACYPCLVATAMWDTFYHLMASVTLDNSLATIFGAFLAARSVCSPSLYFAQLKASPSDMEPRGLRDPLVASTSHCWASGDVVSFFPPLFFLSSSLFSSSPVCPFVFMLVHAGSVRYGLY